MAMACFRRTLLLAALTSMVLAAMPAFAVDREKGLKPPPVPGVPDFVDLDPIVLPVIERNRVTRQIGLMLTLELFDGQPAQAIDEEKRLRLMDAFVRELHLIYSARSTAERVVDEDIIKRRLLRIADGVLGTGVVHAILVRRLIEQRG
ncbi:MAG TPA: hypothetical protein VGP50_03920 [Stellaceae bacterium]|jgi:hypothetical protein|nr:hypothetical protein [Stellaceae bacterium]